MLRAQRQVAGDVEDGHAALRVVTKLGGTAREEALVGAGRHVPDAVGCARQRG